MPYIFYPFLITAIELQFEQMSYMFLESIASDAVVNIVIANFNQLIIENDVSVAVNINPSATNATENGAYMSHVFCVMLKVHNIFLPFAFLKHVQILELQMAKCLFHLECTQLH